LPLSRIGRGQAAELEREAWWVAVPAWFASIVTITKKSTASIGKGLLRAAANRSTASLAQSPAEAKAMGY
jgi:hypothetical protein